MEFERNIDPKEAMNIGLGPDGILAKLINDALPSSEKYKDYTYQAYLEKGKTKHFWLYEYVGSYFLISKSSSMINSDDTKELRSHFIHHVSSVETKTYPAYDFLLSLGIIL